jgi:hypothetical protein
MNKIVVVLICLSATFPVYCQQDSPIGKNSFALSAETQVPVQQLVRFAYSLNKSGLPLGFSFFIQSGLSSYIGLAVDNVIDKKEKANSYLKENLKPQIGFGTGLGLTYHRWTGEVAYQNTAYMLDHKIARELVANLVPENASDITVRMDKFSSTFPLFGNVYSKYRLTPTMSLHQVLVQAGYKFPLRKNSRMGCLLKIGALFIVNSSLIIRTDQSNAAADYIINILNSSLQDKISAETDGHIFPAASFSLYIII